MKTLLIIAVIYTTMCSCEIKAAIRIHDLCDTGVVLYHLSYNANWELVKFVCSLCILLNVRVLSDIYELTM